jgi:hypothetical protein
VAGKFQVAESNQPCQACVTSCAPGQELNKVCSATTNAYCTACPLGKFKTGTNDLACVTCKSTCTTDYFLTGPCGGFVDYVCSQCVNCADGFTWTGGCFKTAVEGFIDRICTDITPPVIVLTGSSAVTVEAATFYADEGATVSDSTHDILAITTTNPIPSDLKPAGFVTPAVYMVRYNAVDNHGNAATEVTRIVTIMDRTKPVVTRRGDAAIVIEAGLPYVDAGATAADSLEGNVTFKLATSNPIEVFPANTPAIFVVTYNVADKALNAAVEVQRTVTVLDTLPPVITVAGALAVEAEVAEAFEDLGATATDVYEGDMTAHIVGTATLVSTGEGAAPLECPTAAGGMIVPVRPSELDPPAASYGVNTRLAAGSVYRVDYNLVDRAGNHDLKQRLVTLVDTVNPVVALVGEAELTLEYNRVAEDNVYVDQGATASDSLDGDLTSFICTTVEVVPSATQSSDTHPPALRRAVAATGQPVDAVMTNVTVGSQYIITYSVQDFSGNRHHVQRVVTVVDTTKPVIKRLGEPALTVLYGVPYVDAGATAFDTYDDTIAPGTAGKINVRSPSTQRLTYYATDSQGNKAVNVTRTVTVSPLVAPPDVFLYSVGFRESTNWVTANRAALDGNLSLVVGGLAFIVAVAPAAANGDLVQSYAKVGVRSKYTPFLWLPTDAFKAAFTTEAVQLAVSGRVASAELVIGPPGLDKGAVVGGVLGAVAIILLVLLVLFILAVRFNYVRNPFEGVWLAVMLVYL